MDNYGKKIKENVKEWKANLLDLTLRNKALNFKGNKQGIEFKYEDLNLILDVLFDDKKLKLNPTRKQEKNWIETFDNLLEIDNNPSNSSSKGTTIDVDLTKSDLNVTFSSMYRKQELFNTEYSIDISYLTVGMLSWKPDQEDDKLLDSPLVFIPVKFDKSKNKDCFVSLKDSDLMLNDSLIQKILFEKGVDLSYEFDSEESINERIEKYFAFVQEKLPSYTIKREIWISLFQFSNIFIYKDLETNEQKLIQDQLVASLFDDEKLDMSPVEVSKEELDLKIGEDGYYHLLESDSSQEKAIHIALKGKSFVLQGPPGTGKSQTIVNILTEFISRGKSVLFVAEKKAALDVVYNKLEELNLANWVARLHSIEKTNKKEFLQQLSDNLTLREKSPKVVSQRYTDQQKENYKENLKKLNSYFKKISYSIWEEKTLYDILNYYILLKETPIIEWPWNYDFSFLENSSYQKILEQLNHLEKLVKIGYDYTIFNNLKITELLPVEQIKFKNLISDFLEVTKTYPETYLEKLLNTFLFEQKIYRKNPNYLQINNPNNLAFLKSISENIKIFIDNQDILEKFSDPSSLLKFNLEEFNYFYENKGFKKWFCFGKLGQTKKKLISLLKDKKEFKIIAEKAHKVINSFNKFITLHNEWEMDQFVFFQNNVDTLINKLDSYLSNSMDLNGTRDEKLFNLLLELQNYFIYESPINVSAFMSQISAQFNNIDNIDTYIEYNQLRKEIAQSEIDQFVKRVHITNLNHSSLIDLFNKSIYHLILKNEFYKLNNEIPDLNYIQNQFRENFERIKELASELINDNLLQKLPSSGSIYENNVEFQFLKKEINKKTRHSSIKQMFEKMPNLIYNLKPILMMSPLSVAAFFKNNDKKFDLVIFDEASQIKVETAISSILRGKQAILVGDREQLPPTNFFNKSMDNAENEEDEEQELEYESSSRDYESILDFVSTKWFDLSLEWHYRSKFDELILPSNKEIYQDKLIAFPNNTLPQKYQGITLVKIDDGIYTNSKNEKEAQKVIEVLDDLLRSNPNANSVGIIAFNSQQQSLIEKKINAYLNENPEFLDRLVFNTKEKLFVKNIENVQGDERDFIIISSVIGPNERGTVTRNIGAVSLKGGYRRLNVCFTRAKIGSILITSVNPEDIDISNASNPRGWMFFKDYLNFAKNKHIQNDFSSSDEKSKEFKISFVKELSELINSWGFETKIKVGISNFKVDIGVFSKKDHNKFICAIECDGDIYKYSKSTKDREYVRKKVLESKGWNVYRIWASNWFRNKKDEMKKLNDTILRFENNQPAPEAQYQVSKEEKFEPKIAKYQTKIENNNIDIFPKMLTNQEIIDRLVLENGKNILYQTFNANLVDKLVEYLQPVKSSTISNILNYKKTSVDRYLNDKYNARKINRDYEDFFFFDFNSIFFKDRRYNIDWTKFTIAQISYLEVAQMLYKLIKDITLVDHNRLFKLYLEFLGFKNAGEKIKAKFDEAIELLIKTRKIEKVHQDDEVMYKVR